MVEKEDDNEYGDEGAEVDEDDDDNEVEDLEVEEIDNRKRGCRS